MDKLILIDTNKELCYEWELLFKNDSEVTVINDRIENSEEYDCIVSPGNSFGLMDGGIDLAIINLFGKQLQDGVQQQIIEAYSGEQNVGTSFIIETGNVLHPYLAHTPTMRVPMSINGTENVYLAMKAMLKAVTDFNKNTTTIKTVLCPGLGTATGRVPPEIAAKQMYLAYQFHKHPPAILNWKVAAERNKEIVQVL